MLQLIGASHLNVVSEAIDCTKAHRQEGASNRWKAGIVEQLQSRNGADLSLRCLGLEVSAAFETIGKPRVIFREHGRN